VAGDAAWCPYRRPLPIAIARRERRAQRSPSLGENDLSEVLTVESALRNVSLSVPEAAAIWITLVLVAVIAAMALLPVRLRAGGRAARKSTDPEPDDRRRRADEIAAAAERAAATARRHRSQWERAHADVAAAWAAYEEADRAARRATAASAYPVMSRRRAPGENADRERYLHVAATAACGRRDISAEQLGDALAHRGWDARKHPAAQETMLRQAVRRHRFDTYRAATAREREAWQRAERAAEALRDLRAEAMAAEIRTHAGARPAGTQRETQQPAIEQPVGDQPAGEQATIEEPAGARPLPVLGA
jgi:hypothetical protein